MCLKKEWLVYVLHHDKDDDFYVRWWEKICGRKWQETEESIISNSNLYYIALGNVAVSVWERQKWGKWRIQTLQIWTNTNART